MLGGLIVWFSYNPEVISLRYRNSTLKAKVEELNSTLNGLVAKLKRLEREKGNLQENLTLLEDSLKEKEDMISKLKSLIDQLQEQIASLKNKLVKVQGGAYVEALPDREYYDRAKQLISRANSSIHIAVFILKYDPHESIYSDPVNMLLKALVDAKKRGVDVRVVVDDVTKREYGDTIEYLKVHGIPVRLDPSGNTLLHAKIMVIDGMWVFVGSHNWSESAMHYNKEYSLLVRSRTIASKVESYFEDLWSRGRRA